MSRTPNDNRSDSLNPNNDAYWAAIDNHSNQLNPNNSAYAASREYNYHDENASNLPIATAFQTLGTTQVVTEESIVKLVTAASPFSEEIEAIHRKIAAALSHN